jgi:hypothetical protein
MGYCYQEGASRTNTCLSSLLIAGCSTNNKMVLHFFLLVLCLAVLASALCSTCTCRLNTHQMYPWRCRSMYLSEWKSALAGAG